VTDAHRGYTALQIASVLATILLAIQYVLGLWTNVYGPSSYTASTSYPPLLAHYVVGYAVGLVALLALVFACLTRETRMIGLAFIVLITVAAAGLFGMLFIRSTPNNPLDSIAMGVLFLLALGSASQLAYTLRSRLGPLSPGGETRSTPAASP
jgi:hypothetical protein